MANGGITFTQQWWDFDADKGKYFDIRSPRRESVVRTWSSASSGPRLDEQHDPLRPGALEPALFGRRRSDVQAVPTARSSRSVSITWWSTTSQDSTRASPSTCANCRRLLRPGESGSALAGGRQAVTALDPNAPSSNDLTGALAKSRQGTLTPVRCGHWKQPGPYPRNDNGTLQSKRIASGRAADATRPPRRPRHGTKQQRIKAIETELS